jgi:hypothetical protein
MFPLSASHSRDGEMLALVFMACQLRSDTSHFRRIYMMENGYLQRLSSHRPTSRLGSRGYPATVPEAKSNCFIKRGLQQSG